MKPIVFIPEPIAECGLDLLKSDYDCVAPWQNGTEADRKVLYDADAVIVRLFSVGQQDFEQCRRLKVVAKHGVGVDNIDVQAAAEAGISVVSTPRANANAVAEHTLTLMLALARNIAPAGSAIAQDRFSDRGQYQGVELEGRTLGVIGLGNVGRRVARMAANGLGMSVLAYDPFLPEGAETDPAVLEPSLEALLSAADFLTLHVSLTPETRHLINAESLRLMKPDCRIVNTSRGAVIDEIALASALSQGHPGGAALDVFEEEPIPADHPLVSAPNTLLTPHIASSTKESLDRMSLQAAQGVIDVLNGKTPQYPVNS
ncbi:MAG: hydroxyacid dehydrogenase [Fuerstiella sp.]|nr:hydroxyacid dehydrogenase [Fuerstiella sp.]